MFLMKLRRAMPTFALDRKRGRFRSWLWLVTMNALADWGRERAGQERLVAGLRELPRAEDPSASVVVAEDFEREHRRRVLAHAMGKIKAESDATTWACFVGRALRQRPAAEVAKELGLTTGAVYTNTSRVLSRLRECCADFEEELGGE